MKAVNLFRSYEDSGEDPVYSEVGGGGGGGGGGDVGLDGLGFRCFVFNPQCLHRSQLAGPTCMCLSITITRLKELWIHN